MLNDDGDRSELLERLVGILASNVDSRGTK